MQINNIRVILRLLIVSSSLIFAPVFGSESNIHAMTMSSSSNVISQKLPPWLFNESYFNYSLTVNGENQLTHIMINDVNINCGLVSYYQNTKTNYHMCSSNERFCCPNTSLNIFPGVSSFVLTSIQNAKNPFISGDNDVINSSLRVDCIVYYMNRNITVDKLFLNKTCKNKGTDFNIAETYDCLDAYSGLSLRLNTTESGNYSFSYSDYKLFSTNVMLNGTLNKSKNSVDANGYTMYYEIFIGCLATTFIVSVVVLKLNKKH